MQFADSYHYDQSGYQAEKLSYNDNPPTDSAALENYRLTFVQYSSQPPLSMQQYPQSPQMSIPPTYTSPSPPRTIWTSIAIKPTITTTFDHRPRKPLDQMSPQQPGSPAISAAICYNEDRSNEFISKFTYTESKPASRSNSTIYRQPCSRCHSSRNYYYLCS